MRIVLAALCLPFLIFTDGLNVKGQAWRQIVPLKSTRADVDRLLGSTTGDYFAQYELKQGSLFIEYSSGPCKPERKGGWNVPRDVVIMVHFTPKRRTRIASLKLDPKKFRKIVDDHVIGAVYYVNDEEGITYAVQQGKVDFVEYHAKKKDEYLYCSALKTNRSAVLSPDPVPDGNSWSLQKPIMDPDDGSGRTFLQDRPRLDRFAKAMKENNSSEAYIIAYGGLVSYKNEAKIRLNCTRKYLMTHSWNCQISPQTSPTSVVTPDHRSSPTVSTAAQQSSRAKAGEQTIFGAEEEIRRPVSVPGDVLKILRRDQRNQKRLAEGQTPDDMPASWFIASEIRLNDDDLPELVVMATNPRLFGANIVPFWVFRKILSGYELALSVSALGLEVLKTKTNGHYDIRTTAATAKEVLTMIYSFDGITYRERRSTQKPIRE